MIAKIISIVLCLSVITFSGCDDKKDPDIKAERAVSLTKEMAETLAKLPLKCAHKEFPNKLNQTLSDGKEIGLPKSLHPAFYGCFDWHSSVHGHWMMVKLLKMFPDLSSGIEIRKVLQSNISAENIAVETDYFLRESEKSFERTYGWAWLLKLHEELLLWDDPISSELQVNLLPLTNLMVSRYTEFLPRLLYPIRSGEHPNTAFGLSLAYDYAKTSKNDILQKLIEQRAKDFFMSDVNCPVNWEPSGFDFLSPCFQEADLMAKVLDAEEFKIWLTKFLPALHERVFEIDEAKVSDRRDGKLVHLDGVNFCRAWSLFNIAQVIPEYDHLINVANKHIHASLPNIVDGGYEGEHWLASFAIYALTTSK